MTMKFRCHQDPKYYDPSVNDKIFVPLMPEVSHRTNQSATYFSICLVLTKQSIFKLCVGRND